MKRQIQKGATSQSLHVFIQDSSATTGVGLTGLVFNSASLTAYYARQGSAATAITLATQTASGAFSSGGFCAVDGTNMPGVYRLDIPDAAVASGVDSVVVMLKGATNMAPLLLELELVAYNPNDAVRMGLTALPNAAAAANGGLATVDASNAVKVQQGTGANQINLSSGNVSLSSSQTFNMTGNITGNLSGSVGSVTSGVTVTTNNDKSGYALSSLSIQAIWDALTSALTTTGSIGKRLVDNIDATISSRLASASYSAAPTVGDIADAVWDEAISGHLGAGSTGNALNSAGSAGDPWSTPLPGAYGSGTAGNILGNNLNATVSSRSTQTSVDTVDTVVDAIKLKTDNLPSDPADASDIATSFAGVNTKLDAIDDFIDTEVSAIKSKTDQLTFTTANQIDATTVTNSDKTGYSLSSGQLFIKKNTALSNFMFVMTDSTTHVPTSGLTVTAQRSIDGGSFASCTNSPSGIASGVYKIDLSASDLNGTVIALRFTASGADDRIITVVTQA